MVKELPATYWKGSGPLILLLKSMAAILGPPPAFFFFFLAATVLASSLTGVPSRETVVYFDDIVMRIHRRFASRQQAPPELLPLCFVNYYSAMIIIVGIDKFCL